MSNDVVREELLGAALEYAEKGWAVIPLQVEGKLPVTEHAVLDATTDTDQIRKWWESLPYNIGIACGQSGLVVIDVDPRNGGKAESVFFDATIQIVKTGGGGWHFYYAQEDDVTYKRQHSDGVDIQSGNKYVVAPPSKTEDHYQWWQHGSEIRNMPVELLLDCIKIETKTEWVTEDEDDNRPSAEWAENNTWEDILTPHGWKLLYTSGGVGCWTRPGKSDGVSATTNHDGTNIFYVFSSNAEPFQADTGYGKFTAYTYLNFGGDFKAAARSIAQEQEYGSIVFSKDAAINHKSDYEFVYATPPEHILSRYVYFGELQTDAPKEYHEAGGLSLLALVSRGIRGQLAPFPSGLPTNLYLLLVGPTSRSRKSTAQRIALDMAEIVYPSTTLPQRTTTESLIDRLAARSHLPTLWAPDEFGVQIAEIYNRSFLAGLEEILLTIYAGDTYTYQRVSGNVTITGPHLNVLGAATPESLGRAGATAMESGLLPRFGVVYPASLPDPRAAGRVSEEILETRRALVKDYRAILSYVQNKNPAMKFTDDALAHLNDRETVLAESGLYAARLPVMLYKVAMLLALGDLTDTVSIEHAEASVGIINRWSDGASNLTRILRRSKTDAEFESDLKYALEVTNKLGGEVHRTKIARVLEVPSSTLDRIERTLIDRGRIITTNNVWRVLDD